MNPARRYSLVTFLTWLPTGLYMAPMVLLMLGRGLDLPTIAMVGLAYSLTVAVLELPTGGLSDVVGRRGVLIAASVASLAGLVLMGYATTAALFAVSAVLRGAARALGSGPAEAWYVDTMHAAHGHDAPIGPGLAKGAVASSAALAIGTITGGVIPLALAGVVATPLAVPVLLAAAVEAARLIVVVAALPEPRHARVTIKEVLRGVPVSVRTGLTLSLRDGALARLLLLTGALGVMLATIELLTPPWLATATGTLETAGIAYALVASLGFAASALGGALSPRVTAAVRTPARTALVGMAVMVAALGLLGGATVRSGLTAVIVAAVAYGVIFIGLGIGSPATATITHGRVTAQHRATVLSVQSLALQLAGALGVMLLARLADQTGATLTFLVLAALTALSGLLLRSRALSLEPQTDTEGEPDSARTAAGGRATG